MAKVQMVPVPREVRENGRLKYRKGAMVEEAELARLDAAGLLSGDAAPNEAAPAAPKAPEIVPGIWEGKPPAEADFKAAIAAHREAVAAASAPAPETVPETVPEATPETVPETTQGGAKSASRKAKNAPGAAQGE
jgi:hypothetical protein